MASSDISIAAANLTWFNAYHPCADHLQFLRDLQALYPTTSEIVVAGNSNAGSPITGIHFWGSAGKGIKPAVVIRGTVHARQWITTMTGMSNSAEWRRRQNRLNQREYRKRKETQTTSKLAVKNRRPKVEGSQGRENDEKVWPCAGPKSFNLPALPRKAALCNSDFINEERILSRLMQRVSAKTTGSPVADCLLILVKFNFFRSMCLNYMFLGFQADKDLCTDLVGFANSETARTGVIVWGEHPWDPAGWEVTEQYLKK
ncbi:hypothetical protein DL95DRAFT_476461 [Leptodontidium sp. 2 PMI_412]|nr:hypothetical protein DL95DRAFT_476461 [Leptodontidium sp. 2 PMI_412]